MESKKSKEEDVLSLSVQMWNKFLETDLTHPDDVADFRYFIHRIQDMMYSALYRREHGTIEAYKPLEKLKEIMGNKS